MSIFQRVYLLSKCSKCSRLAVFRLCGSPCHSTFQLPTLSGHPIRASSHPINFGSVPTDQLACFPLPLIPANGFSWNKTCKPNFCASRFITWQKDPKNDEFSGEFNGIEWDHNGIAILIIDHEIPCWFNAKS